MNGMKQYGSAGKKCKKSGDRSTGKRKNPVCNYKRKKGGKKDEKDKLEESGVCSRSTLYVMCRRCCGSRKDCGEVLLVQV